jgi:hypothetical protein
MSSPSSTRTFLFPLPDGRELEAILVKLPDGRVVIRSREELEPAPGTPAPKEER